MSDFHERFDIEVDMEEARKRFIERARNEIFGFLPRSSDSLRSLYTKVPINTHKSLLITNVEK